MTHRPSLMWWTRHVLHLPAITRLTSTCSGTQALDSLGLSSLAQKKWIRLLYRTCGQRELLPRTLEVPICYDRTGNALFRGGYADVWKGECCGREVAVKVIRTYSTSDLQKIIGVGRWAYSLSTVNSLTELVEVLQGGSDVEIPSASECPTANGGDNVRESVRDGIGLDGEWKHPRIRQGTSRCRPARACRFSVQVLATLAPLTTAKPQLAGVAKGLIYIHSQGMIHGDLKGVRL